MSHRVPVATWSAGILIWCVMCVGGWVLATREDYARLAVARACYTVGESQTTPSRCADIKRSDMLIYKAAIDRKATISRISASFGSMALIISLVFVRRRVHNT